MQAASANWACGALPACAGRRRRCRAQAQAQASGLRLFRARGAAAQALALGTCYDSAMLCKQRKQAPPDSPAAPQHSTATLAAWHAPQCSAACVVAQAQPVLPALRCQPQCTVPLVGACRPAACGPLCAAMLAPPPLCACWWLSTAAAVWVAACSNPCSCWRGPARRACAHRRLRHAHDHPPMRSWMRSWMRPWSRRASPAACLLGCKGPITSHGRAPALGRWWEGQGGQGSGISRKAMEGRALKKSSSARCL